MTDGSLVRSLFDGRVDVVADVHGELQALLDLMSHLGYRKDGTHPEDRRLVFLGDLVDRGPASLATVNLVKTRVENGLAECILGNHELNILLGRRREGNDWFFALNPEERSRVQSFFRKLPLALERPGLRVVHAFWHDAMIEVARQSDDVVALYEHHAVLIEEKNAADPALDESEKRLNSQNLNPAKLLTSGPERRASTPSFKGGKWRHEERAEWWLEYAGPEAVVFGHYAIPCGEPHVFGNAVCVDYGVGYRHREREGVTGRPKTRLGAFRLPEKVIVHDGGSVEVAA